jgi:hypothetical protein
VVLARGLQSPPCLLRNQSYLLACRRCFKSSLCANMLPADGFQFHLQLMSSSATSVCQLGECWWRAIDCISVSTCMLAVGLLLALFKQGMHRLIYGTT